MVYRRGGGEDLGSGGCGLFGVEFGFYFRFRKFKIWGCWFLLFSFFVKDNLIGLFRYLGYVRNLFK